MRIAVHILILCYAKSYLLFFIFTKTNLIVIGIIYLASKRISLTKYLEEDFLVCQAEVAIHPYDVDPSASHHQYPFLMDQDPHLQRQTDPEKS